MTTTLSFSFQHRPLVPFAHDYAHGDQEDWHQHDCAQLLHILSGVVRVATPVGYWVVPPGRVSSLALGERYAPASRDERIYELILDEIRGMAILPFGLPEPQSETLRRLCQQVREVPGEAWSSGQAAKACSMSERTLNRHFQQQTSLTWSEWVRRAKLMEALVRLAQGHSVLRVALELGYGSHSAFSAMFRRVMGVAPSDYFRPPA